MVVVAGSYKQSGLGMDTALSTPADGASQSVRSMGRRVRLSLGNLGLGTLRVSVR